MWFESLSDETSEEYLMVSQIVVEQLKIKYDGSGAGFQVTGMEFNIVDLWPWIVIT